MRLARHAEFLYEALHLFLLLHALLVLKLLKFTPVINDALGPCRRHTGRPQIRLMYSTWTDDIFNQMTPVRYWFVLIISVAVL